MDLERLRLWFGSDLLTNPDIKVRVLDRIGPYTRIPREFKFYYFSLSGTLMSCGGLLPVLLGFILMKQLILLVGVTLLGVSLPAEAQSYHQNYGGSRVTNQNQTGLYHNDPSYINCGTMSRSAQGKQAGMTTGGLPNTAWGGYIRNPGDDIYTGNNGAMRMQNGSMVYGDEIVHANQVAAMKRQRMQNRYRQQQMQYSNQPQGNVYVPGSNGGASNYGSGGAATYSSYGRR